MWTSYTYYYLFSKLAGKKNIYGWKLNKLEPYDLVLYPSLGASSFFWLS